MIDISVKQIIAEFKGIQIIAEFKGIKRKEIFSNKETDSFLDLLDKKNKWTISEYKEFILAYSLEYMKTKFIDYMKIHAIKKKYGFKLNWDDYFHIIDSLPNFEKKAEYINYYIWYHYLEINESVFKKLMLKPYFNTLSNESRLEFLKHIIKTDNSKSWVKKYFEKQELINALKENALYVNVYDEKEGYINEKKENKVKLFFNQHEYLFDKDTKIKLFLQVVKSGSTRLIDFFYKEKKINNVKTLALLWAVCSDTAANNTLEILHCLKDIGIKFKENDLDKLQKNTRWNYAEHTQELLHFFKTIESEKNYNKLNLKFKNKKIVKNIDKI